ncbi:MAG: hypothetical protein RMY28_035190 [Nostoc sp. ChiSLP01]|nr:hypothetical protein [Nostoc sp. CmiSLP01]MDZ8287411.1 hypothetical protein [Nostoc sp. ChiSLP01]
MTNTQRLDNVEDELETVKQLLVSTANYSESANRKVDQLCDKLDAFITHTQRLFTKTGSEIEETKARTERLEALMLKLDRNYEEQKSQFYEFQSTTVAALERIDRVLDYLMRQ